MIHSPTRRRSSVAALLVAGLVPLGVAASATSASSDDSVTSGPQGFTVELLSRGTIDEPFEVETKGIELEAERPIDVAVARVTLEPGGTSGWHVHPGPAVVTITSGELTHIDKHCARESFQTGQTYIERGRRDLGTVLNTGATTTEVIVTFFVPTGAELTVPRPAPQRCSR
jgi:hypothetical protein